MKVNHMLVAAALTAFVMAPAAFADSGKGKGGTGGTVTPGTSGVADTRLVAKLRPVTSQDSLFEGHVVLRTSGGGRGEFESRVEVPQTLLGPDPDNLQPILMLSNGIPCTMVFDEIEPVSGVVEYKVSIRSRNGVIVNRAGFCGAVGASPTIPVVNLNDRATVDIGGDTLQGFFAAKR
ncbi:MAG: hypothetical protein E8D46_03595 [Nitrospira sp.]|nr:MAG: hypothetical protein E8D46_03595 [Nitrospira sp.]